MQIQPLSSFLPRLTAWPGHRQPSAPLRPLRPLLLAAALLVLAVGEAQVTRQVAIGASGVFGHGPSPHGGDGALVAEPRPKQMMRAHIGSAAVSSATIGSGAFEETGEVVAAAAAQEHAGKPAPSTAYLGPVLDRGGDVSVLYSIGASNNKDRNVRIKAILSTWASRLTPRQLLFVGHKPSAEELPRARWDPAPTCLDNHDGGACKDMVGLADGFLDTDAKWVMLLGDDNYVVTGNVEEALKWHDHEKPIAFGILGCGPSSDCPTGMCGGGGQIFSRGALRLLLKPGREIFFNESNKVARNHTYYGDLAMCAQATKAEVMFSGSLKGLHGWGLNKEAMRESVGSKAPTPLSYHYCSPDDMEFLHSTLNLHFLRRETSGRVDSYMSKYLAARDEYVRRETEKRAKASASRARAVFSERTFTEPLILSAVSSVSSASGASAATTSAGG